MAAVVTEVPAFRSAYELRQCIGQGASSTVWTAYCKTLGQVVAVKVIDMEGVSSTFEEIRKEVQTLSTMHHPNVVTYYTSFVDGHHLWLVMKYFGGGSVLDLMRYKFTKGLEENVIATILRETLKGLEYIHQNNQIHRDIKAGNILVDLEGNVQIADFGVSAALVDNGQRVKQRKTFVGTPCWMAPEVMEQVHGYDFKADIWSFGITALELAKGEAPYARLKPMQIMMMTMDKDPPQLEENEKYSSAFRDLIHQCLHKDPVKRPSTAKLLEHKFFRNAKNGEYLRDHLLKGLPELSDRARAIMQKVPPPPGATLAQEKKAPPVSAWDFDVTAIKQEAARLDEETAIARPVKFESEDDQLTEEDHSRMALELTRSGIFRMQKEMQQEFGSDGSQHSTSNPTTPVAASVSSVNTPPLSSQTGSEKPAEVRKGRFAVSIAREEEVIPPTPLVLTAIQAMPAIVRPTQQQPGASEEATSPQEENSAPVVKGRFSVQQEKIPPKRFLAEAQAKFATLTVEDLAELLQALDDMRIENEEIRKELAKQRNP